MLDVAIDTPGEYLQLSYYMRPTDVGISAYLITPEGTERVASLTVKALVDPQEVGQQIGGWTPITRTLRMLALSAGLGQDGWVTCGESDLLFRPTTSGPRLHHAVREELLWCTRRVSLLKNAELSRRLVAYRLTPFGRVPIDVSDVVVGLDARVDDERFAARLEGQGWQRSRGLTSMFHRPAEPRAEVAPSAAPTTRPLTCPGCGAAVGRGKFCGGCGHSLEARSCRACHAPVDAGSRFCVECGSAVTDAP